VVRNAAVDGFIVYSTPPETPVVLAAFARRLPTVIVDSPATEGVDFVTIDDRAAAATAVRHLLELGHRRLGVMVLPLAAHGAVGPVGVERQEAATSSWGKARLDGCAQAIAEAGLDWAQVPIEECAASSVEAGRAGAHALLDRAPATTAIFAFSDPLALGARFAAHDRGLMVPGDLSIVGFDDTAPAAQGLTTVHQPHYDKGRVGTELLVGALAERPTSPRREVLPTHLVVRESTGPLRRETAVRRT
jgi:DNA-binding LacI/PurR family transcriptional regulator